MHNLDLRLSPSSPFSSHAADELKKVIDVYTTSIIDECNRLAAAETLDGRPTEITAAIVKKADTVFQISNGIHLEKRPPAWLRISSTILPIITGVFPNLVEVKNGPYMAIMLLLLVFSTALVVTVIIKDRIK